MLAPHNTKISFSTHNQILQKNLFSILKLSIFQIKRVNWLKQFLKKTQNLKDSKLKLSF